jgi:hypothetical protein
MSQWETGKTKLMIDIQEACICEPWHVIKLIKNIDENSHDLQPHAAFPWLVTFVRLLITRSGVPHVV